MPEVLDEAGRRGIEVIVRSTAEASRLLAHYEEKRVGAILHVTC